MEYTASSFDQTVIHPVQSYAWGEFRKQSGVAIERLVIDGRGYLITFHGLPIIGKTIGIMTQCHMPSRELIDKLNMLGKKHDAISIKIEPYTYSPITEQHELTEQRRRMRELGLVKSKALYPHFSFVVRLDKPEEELLAAMKSKTRYNIRLAEKKRVQAQASTEDQAFARYLALLQETTDRQAFYAHTKNYQLKMWKAMKAAGMGYVIEARYNEMTLAAFVLFVFGGRLYYPYGASTRTHKELMAPQYLMWEVMKFGKKMHCRELELWGSLGAEPDPADSWYGFHRFKSGFGGTHIEYVGAYDLVLEPVWNTIYQTADRMRWWWLKKVWKR